MDPVDPDYMEKLNEAYRACPNINRLELTVCGMLHTRQMSGYDIVKLLESKAKITKSVFTFNKTTLYNTLKRLNKEGSIEVVDEVQEGHRPTKTIYKLTPKGEEKLKEMVLGVLESPPFVYYNYASALVFADVLTKEELIENLSEKVEQAEFLGQMYGRSAEVIPGKFQAKLAECSAEMMRSLESCLAELLHMVQNTPEEELWGLGTLNRDEFIEKMREVKT